MIIPNNLNNFQPIIDAQELFINEYHGLFWEESGLEIARNKYQN